jgi:predicted RNA-binding protein (virulence factor B family)
MPYEDLLGRIVTLAVRRFGSPGAFLAVNANDARPNAPVILLPGSEVPEDAREGDELSVLIYLDSEDRPVATLKPPKITLGEVAFLTVKDVTSFGAFVDWGPPKELLVPRAEQIRDIHVGERHPIGLFVDDSGRLAGSMRVSEMLKAKPDFDLDEWVMGEAWRSEPELGVFFILERRYVGLLPASEPHELSRGQATRVRVASVLPDGKIEVSLRGHAHEELEGDAEKILKVLERPGAPRVGDRSSPDEIRALFGLSKKAFKRAAGRLLKQGSVSVDQEGFFTPRRRPPRASDAETSRGSRRR